MVGGAGDDLLTGGEGSDRFELAVGTGTDTIADFSIAHDSIQLGDGLTFGQLSLVRGTGVNTNDTLIQAAESHEALAILTGVQSDSLSTCNFVSI